MGEQNREHGAKRLAGVRGWEKVAGFRGIEDCQRKTSVLRGSDATAVASGNVVHGREKVRTVLWRI